MKKILSVAVIMSVVLSIYIPSKAEENNFSLKLSLPVTDIVASEAVYVDINVSNYSDIYAYEFSYTYDKNYLEFIQISSDFQSFGYTAESTDITSGYAQGSYMFTSSGKTSGVSSERIARLEFKAVKSGTSSVKVSETKFLDSSLNLMKITDENYSIPIVISKPQINTGGGGSGGGGGGIIISGDKTVTTDDAPKPTPIDIEDSNLFSDISKDYWAYSTVKWASDNHIVSGYSDGSFKPDEAITRAECCSILYNMFGTNESNYLYIDFFDVNENYWAYDAVSWAYNNKIVNGYEDGNFKPDEFITRAEYVVMLNRLEKHEKSDRKNTFTDVSDEHWAFNEINWAYDAGIIEGYEDGGFKPDSEVSRAECVTILKRYNEFNSNENSQDQNDVLGMTTHILAENEAAASDKPEILPSLAPSDVPEETVSPTDMPAETTNPRQYDITYDCGSLDELYKSNNISFYEIFESDREAFYDDFTTFQRSGGGDAYAIYELPYAVCAAVETYHLASKVKDFSFEVSSDGEAWTLVTSERIENAQDGKWTVVEYFIDSISGYKYLKINWGDNETWWTPLIAKMSVDTEKPRAERLEIMGDNHLQIPRYDNKEYQFFASLFDQMGNEMITDDVEWFITGGDERISISQNGVLTVSSGINDGTSFKIAAETEELGLRDEVEITLSAQVPGDLDNDFKITDNDISIILKWYKSTSGDSDWLNIREGDINKDEKIDVEDIAYVAYHIETEENEIESNNNEVSND